jgi:lipopolysaccharide transport system permease protein
VNETAAARVAEQQRKVRVRIEPTRGGFRLDLADLWRHRELLYFLVWRDVKLRYKQTVFGLAWAVIPPVLTMIVFTIFFGRVADLDSNGVPYPIFSFAALLPWLFFASGVTQAATSMVGNVNLITKVYFPRILIPVAATLPGLIDFVVALVVLAGLMAYYGYAPGLESLLVVPLLLIALTSAVGVGVLLGALNVKFRDVRYAIPFLFQFWLFASPIAFSSALIDEPWRTLYGLNPMAGVVEGFRAALLPTELDPTPMVLVSAATSLVLLFAGVFYFRRTERAFADVI